MAIFPNSWFWSKNGHFSRCFSLGNIGKENFFYDILERKIAFLGYKNDIYDIVERKKGPSRLQKQKFQKFEELTFFLRG